jgi:predicted AAA+ superfamily ATPase
MAHLRKRHLSQLLKKIATGSPLVGVLGHRQVGKTTLLESIANQYLSFDDIEQLTKAETNPKLFLRELQELGTAIDECQIVAKIFPALKERVRVDKRPGQFYLSGSVRFTSQQKIRESLTGRIVNTELLPLTVSELDAQPLPNTLRQIFDCGQMQNLRPMKITAKTFSHRAKMVDKYMDHGGLPGVCFMRDKKLRVQKIVSQIETILDRDLRQIQRTTLTLPELTRYLRNLAGRDLDVINMQELQRKSGITQVTQKKLLYALEATFIVRLIPIEGTSGRAIFFEDQAEVATLAQPALSQDQLWSGFVYRNLREQVFYNLGDVFDFFQFRSRSGVFVPFAIRNSTGALGVIPFLGPLSRKTLAAGQSFLRVYGDAKVIFVSRENQFEVLDSRSAIVPAAWLLWPE